MKQIMIVLFSLLFAACTNAKSYEMFGATVNLNASCEVLVTAPGKSQRYQPKFENPDACRFVTHDKTDILHVEYINGMYIFFVENNVKNGEECFSEYTALGLSEDIKLYTTDFIKQSKSCYRDQELHSFEYFSKKLELNADGGRAE